MRLRPSIQLMSAREYTSFMSSAIETTNERILNYVNVGTLLHERAGSHLLPLRRAVRFSLFYSAYTVLVKRHANPKISLQRKHIDF